jgi:predicted double-glycine peptidase
MVIGSYGRGMTEEELARIVDFHPSVGVSMPIMAKACELINFDYELLKFADLNDLKGYLSKGFYPIVVVKAKIYHEAIFEEYGHFIIVKDITEKNVIVNDPDIEYGGENKCVEINAFLKAWDASKNWILVIKGEIK